MPRDGKVKIDATALKRAGRPWRQPQTPATAAAAHTPGIRILPPTSDVAAAVAAAPGARTAGGAGAKAGSAAGAVRMRHGFRRMAQRGARPSAFFNEEELVSDLLQARKAALDEAAVGAGAGAAAPAAAAAEAAAASAERALLAVLEAADQQLLQQAGAGGHSLLALLQDAAQSGQAAPGVMAALQVALQVAASNPAAAGKALRACLERAAEEAPGPRADHALMVALEAAAAKALAAGGGAGAGAAPMSVDEAASEAAPAAAAAAAANNVVAVGALQQDGGILDWDAVQHGAPQEQLPAPLGVQAHASAPAAGGLQQGAAQHMEQGMEQPSMLQSLWFDGEEDDGVQQQLMAQQQQQQAGMQAGAEQPEAGQLGSLQSLLMEEAVADVPAAAQPGMLQSSLYGDWPQYGQQQQGQQLDMQQGYAAALAAPETALPQEDAADDGVDWEDI